ncbi:MAG: efflux RND transporter periplasmic adaptor subunit [Bacteroidales bacterium]|nr:efflux RND transporter periplasmic adaptor subunit [Bacteroidales bacterium]
MEKKNKRRRWLWIIPIVVILIIVVSTLGKKRTGGFEINSVPVAEEQLSETVTATGVVQPVYKVTVGTQVSGIVKKIYVDYNSSVKQGQLLAELDKSLLQENVNLNRANLSVATSQKNLAQKDFERVKQLFAQKASTQEEYDQAEARLEQATNQLETAKANYDNALTQLRYAEINSPIDGVVISKQVEEGQTVQGAYSVPNLFTIAKNLTEIQVEAKVDEADIGLVHDSQSVTFKVDAYPGEEFHGTVSQIRMEPQTNNNVVTYVVIITASNPDEKLFPGMTASVSIIVKSDTGLCLPLYATQLQPDQATIADLVRQGYTLDTTAVGKNPCVWLKNGRQLTRRPVTLGSKTKVKVIVSEGIAEGDTVVTSIVNYAQQKAQRQSAMFE